MTTGKKVYFASDFHLGYDGRVSSVEREKRIVHWLDLIADDAAAIYLVGDVFDYWYEYKQVVPKGFSRLFGKLAELRDRQIPIYFFIGNHDMWMFRYFEEEFDIPIYREPIERTINGKTFFIGHGDGLGPGDHGYKLIKAVFSNRLAQWCYARLHPNFGLWLMRFFSQKSRDNAYDAPEFLGADKEWLAIFANEQSALRNIDYFVFGHRHLPIDHALKNGKSRYINLGDWVTFQSFAVFDGEKLSLHYFDHETGTYR